MLILYVVLELEQGGWFCLAAVVSYHHTASRPKKHKIYTRTIIAYQVQY